MSQDIEAPEDKIQSALNEIETLRSSANAKVQEISQFFSQFENLRNQVNDGESGAQKTLEIASEAKDKIQSIRTEVDQRLKEIDDLKNIGTTKVQEIEQFFAQFIGLRDQVNNGDSGVQKSLEKVTEHHNSIQNLRTEAGSKLDEIETLRGDVNTRVAAIDTFLQTFEALRTKFLDPENGVEAIVQRIETFEKKAVKAKDSVENEKSQAVKLKEETSAIKIEAENDRKTIGTLMTESEELKTDIQKHLELVSDSARTDAFLQRKKDLEKEVRFWKWSLIIGLGLLAILFCTIYWVQIKNGGFTNWHDLYRYVFTIPVLYFVTLASKNYSDARLYLEKYSFKAITSVTLEAYTKIMRDKFPDYTKELFEFVRDTINSIYNEPYSDKKTRRSVNFNFKPNLGVTAEQEDEDVRRSSTIQTTQTVEVQKE